MKPEPVEIETLRPHPRNYHGHPPDQIAHLVASLQEHGWYRPVVVANDGTILAGHGIVDAARAMGATHVPVIRLPIDPDSPAALRVLAGDNEISRGAEVDDRKLSEILREISLDVAGLMGTGFDAAQLASLAFVTRPASEIATLDEAKEWAGMPAYDESDPADTDDLAIEILFRDKEARDEFVSLSGLQIRSTRGGRKWQTRYPYEARDDLGAVKFETP